VIIGRAASLGMVVQARLEKVAGLFHIGSAQAYLAGCRTRRTVLAPARFES